MLTPLQSSAGTASTTLMQSIIDQAEEKRLDEDEKARQQSKSDDVVKARASMSKSHAALNDKINAHFFGALKSDESPMAELMARFVNLLGMTRDDGESDMDFGTRVEDTLSLVEMIGRKEANLPITSSIPGGEQKITLARFLVSIDDLDAVLDGTAVSPSDNAFMAARFVTRYGLTQEDDEADAAFSKRIGETMASVRKSLPESIAALETKAGLRDLGVTAAQMVKAIKNPGGEDAKFIQEALDDSHRTNMMSSDTAQIALQRLEDIAADKSIEELKLERTHQPDPTRVENDETRKEREEDIRRLEASEKLEDVKDVQEAIGTVNDALGNAPSGDEADVTAGDLLLAMAAGAEMTELAEKAASASDVDDAVAIDAVDQERGVTEAGKEAHDEETAAILLARSGPGDAAAPVGEQAGSGILPVSLDENGIYELLKRQAEEELAIAA